MFRTLIRRRRDEDARVARFLHAIALSGRHTVDEEPRHPWLYRDRTDTVAFPAIILAGTIL